MARKRNPHGYSLYKKREVYYASFYDSADQRIRVSLETKSEATAHRRAQALVSEYTAKPYHDEGSGNGPTIQQVHDQYLADRQLGNGIEASTIKRYNRSLRGLKKVLGNLPISEVNKEALYHYTQKRSGEIVAHSIEQDCNHAKRLAKFAAKRGHYSGDTSDLVPDAIKGSYRPRERMLNPAEVAELLSLAEETAPKRYPHILAWLTLGLRHEDLYGIQVRHVDFDSNTVMVRIQKGKKTLRLPIHAKLRPVLAKQCEGKGPDDRVFYRYSSDWSWLLRRWSAAMGVEDFTIHDLRRTCGGLMASAGVPLRVIADILGHANIATTYRTYSHLLHEAKEEAINRLPI